MVVISRRNYKWRGCLTESAGKAIEEDGRYALRAVRHRRLEYGRAMALRAHSAGPTKIAKSVCNGTKGSRERFQAGQVRTKRQRLLNSSRRGRSARTL
jgi:hypothetical protein